MSEKMYKDGTWKAIDSQIKVYNGETWEDANVVHGVWDPETQQEKEPVPSVRQPGFYLMDDNDQPLSDTPIKFGKPSPVVYTQVSCKYCEILKNWLDSEGIQYEVRNISHNAEFKEEAINKGAMGMPFTVIGEKTFSGFNSDVQEGMLAALHE